MSETLIFLHIPKTGGTTLRSILMKQYEDGKVCCIYKTPIHLSLDDFQKLDDDVKRNYKAIIGHLSYGVHQLLPRDQKYTYATIMREPVRRVMSLYNHLANLQYKDRTPRLVEFLNIYHNTQFDNHQVRILSAIKSPFGKCSEKMLDKAIKNITKRFSFVGLTEFYEETLFLAHKILGWKPVPYVNKNPGSAKPRQFISTLTDEDIELIKNYNWLDIQLYEYVSNLFWEKIKSFGSDWQVQLEQFKSALAREKEKGITVDGVGCLGVITSKKISGWARIKQSDEIARVRILINDTQEFILLADNMRKDLKEKGLHPTGRCGFVLELPDEMRLKPGDKVSARVVGDNKDLKNSPKIYQKPNE